MKKYKREYFYATLLFVLFEMAVMAYQLMIPYLFMYIAVIGLWFMLAWSFFTFWSNRNRKVSKYSSAVINIKMFERVTPYFITPLMLTGATFFYIFLNKNRLLEQLVIIGAVFLLWAVMAHIRNSYQKQYSIDRWTRVLFKFADLFLFYIGTASVFMYSFNEVTRIVIVVAIAAFLLMHQLRLYEQNSNSAYYVYIFSMVAFTAGLILTETFTLLIRPIVITIFFYLIMSLWYLKLSGHRRVDEYLTPFMFALMALIIVLSL
jgi:hypothetical protein